MQKRVSVTNECPTYWWRSHKIIADQGQTKLSFPPKIGNIFVINIMCLIALAYYPDKILVSLSQQMNPINVYKLGPSSWYRLSAILFDLVIPSMEKYKSTTLNKLSVCNNSLYRDKITYDAHQAL